jgi:hypothetical protein
MTDLLNPAEKNKAVHQRFIQEVFNEGRLEIGCVFVASACLP